MKEMIYFSRDQEEIKAKEEKEQFHFPSLGKKLMKDIFSNKKDITEDGKLIRDSINQGVDFNPDLLFEQLVKNYSMAEKIYGKSILRRLANYDPNYIEKNINIPEFRKELKERIDNSVDELKNKKLLDKNNSISEKGLELASLILYKEELDNIMPKGILGEKIHKKHFIYGDKQDIKDFKKDRYRDIAIKKSIKLAIRRKHKSLQKNDLKSFERQSKGSINLVYALDASGSMKGDKIDTCKKAGVALAYKAIDKKDKVGLIVFSSEIKTLIPPTDDFITLLKEITKISASKETNIALTIKKSIELFPNNHATNHLILITDAMPTVDSEDETLEAASIAKSNDLTISIVGIELNDKSKKLAEKITNIGQGNLYIVKDLKELDKIVLEDYYSIE